MRTAVATDVARSVVCVYVFLFVTTVSPAKTAEPIDMPLGGGADSR